MNCHKSETEQGPQRLCRINTGCTSGGVYVPCIIYTHARWELWYVTQASVVLCYIFQVWINPLACWYNDSNRASHCLCDNQAKKGVKLLKPKMPRRHNVHSKRLCTNLISAGQYSCHIDKAGAGDRTHCWVAGNAQVCNASREVCPCYERRCFNPVNGSGPA